MSADTEFEKKKVRHASGQSTVSTDSVSNYIPTPPDGGYGWVIVMAAFFIHVIVDGVTFTFGVFYVAFLEYFEEGKGKTSLVGSLLGGFYLMICFVASALVNKFGCRPVAIAGSLISTLGFVASTFSPNVDVLMLTYGVLGGSGFALTFFPSVISVSFYFQKRRAVATGIAVCGAGVGGFIMAPFGRFLLDVYDWKNAMLIVAGISLNGVVFGALLRPLDPPKKKKRPRAKNVIDRLMEQTKRRNRQDSECSACQAPQEKIEKLQRIQEAKLYRETMLQDEESEFGSVPNSALNSIRRLDRSDSYPYGYVPSSSIQIPRQEALKREAASYGGGSPGSYGTSPPSWPASPHSCALGASYGTSTSPAGPYGDSVSPASSVIPRITINEQAEPGEEDLSKSANADPSVNEEGPEKRKSSGFKTVVEVDESEPVLMENGVKNGIKLENVLLERLKKTNGHIGMNGSLPSGFPTLHHDQTAVNTCPSFALEAQRRPLMVDMGTQCMLLTDDDLPQTQRAASTPVKNDRDSSIDISPIKQCLPSFNEDEDPDYKPSEISIEACEEEDACQESEPQVPQPTSTPSTTMYATEPKYIVFQHKLLELFQSCPVCVEPTAAEIDDLYLSGHGTLVKINQSCTSCGFKRTWDSQPYINKTPVGNLLLSAAVLVSGSQISQVLRLFATMNIKCYSRNTYQRQQSNYVIPTIVNKWKRDQATLLEHLREKPEGLDLAGDCRNDSPGHSAKYGCYTMIEQSTKKVLDLQIVQSNEAGSSNACEIVGFKRSLSFITQTEQMKVHSLVTDRHMGIAAHVRDEVIPFNPQCNELKHYNDVWHTAKGLRKKIEKIGLRDHLANVWKRSILNHVYYVAANAPEENREAYIEEMWVSLVNHIHDNHTHLENELYLYCDHAPILDDREKQWLTQETIASNELTRLIRSDRVKKDIKKLSPKYQTSSLEAFHSLIIRFAPKHTHFSWLGMIARMYLAAMHHNENCCRLQSETKDGIRQYTVCFPKYKGGAHTVKTIRTSCTYDSGEDDHHERRRHHSKSAGDINQLQTPKKTQKYLRPKTIQKMDYSRPMYRKDIFYSGSMLHVPQFRSQPDVKTYAKSMMSIPDVVSPERESCLCRCLPKAAADTIKEMMDITLFKEPIFLVAALGNLFAFVGLFVPFVFIADRALTMGVPEGKAALLLSVIGITNMLGRLIAGALADVKRVNPLLLHNMSLLIAGVASCLNMFSDTYAQMCVYAAVFGLCVATYISLTSIVLCNMLGLERLTNAYGLLCALRGIASIVGPPIAGIVFDATGDYDTSFHVGGVMLFLGGMAYLLLHLPYFQKRSWQNNMDPDAGEIEVIFDDDIAEQYQNAYKTPQSETLPIMPGEEDVNNVV